VRKIREDKVRAETPGGLLQRDRGSGIFCKKHKLQDLFLIKRKTAGIINTKRCKKAASP
jgi:hypothetical protein